MMKFLFTTTPLAYFSSSIWRDEAFSYLMAKKPIWDMLWSTAQDANPPLYYLLLKIWMLIFGHSEVALRALSLIFFWATIYTSFLILYEVFKIKGKRVVLYLSLFVLNPLLHYYAFEARMYSLMAFLATLSFYFLFKKKYTAYAFTALLALYTHYFLILVIASQILVTLFFLHKDKRVHFLRFLQCFVLYIPWIIVLLFAHPPVQQSFWINTVGVKDIPFLLGVLFTGYEATAGFVYKPLIYISMIVGCTLLLGLWHVRMNQKKKHTAPDKQYQWSLIMMWSLGIPVIIFIVSFIKPLFLPRYIIFSTIGLLLVLISIIDQLQPRMRGLLFLILLAVSLHFASTQAILRKKAPVKNTFMTIKSLLGPNDVVYTLHEYDFHPAKYYLNQTQVYIYKKTYEELPWFIGKVLIPKQAITSSLPEFPRRAFVVQPDATSFTIQSLR